MLLTPDSPLYTPGKQKKLSGANSDWKFQKWLLQEGYS